MLEKVRVRLQTLRVGRKKIIYLISDIDVVVTENEVPCFADNLIPFFDVGKAFNFHLSHASLY